MSGKGKSKKEVTRNSMVKRLEQSTWHIVLIGKQDGTSEILTGFDNPQDTASILMHYGPQCQAKSPTVLTAWPRIAQTAQQKPHTVRTPANSQAALTD